MKKLLAIIFIIILNSNVSYAETNNAEICFMPEDQIEDEFLKLIQKNKGIIKIPKYTIFEKSGIIVGTKRDPMSAQNDPPSKKELEIIDYNNKYNSIIFRREKKSLAVSLNNDINLSLSKPCVKVNVSIVLFSENNWYKEEVNGPLPNIFFQPYNIYKPGGSDVEEYNELTKDVIMVADVNLYIIGPIKSVYDMNKLKYYK